MEPVTIIDNVRNMKQRREDILYPNNNLEDTLSALFKIRNNCGLSMLSNDQYNELNIQYRIIIQIRKNKMKDGSLTLKSLSYATITKKINDLFGKDSMQYLLVKIYHEVPVRDNFGKIQIIAGIQNKTDAINMSKKYNYVWFSDDGKIYQIIIQETKTDGKFPLATYPIPPSLNVLLKQFIENIIAVSIYF